MDSLSLQSASTVVGQPQKPGIDQSPEVSQEKTCSGTSDGQAEGASSAQTIVVGTRGPTALEKNVKEHHPPRVLRISSIDSYADSNSTAPSSSVDSSGQNSPVSTSTATSNFYFEFETQSQPPPGDEEASELRIFSSHLSKDSRPRPALTRAVSLDADKRQTIRSNSPSDKGSLPNKQMRRLREGSPRRPSYTFPFRSAHGWSTPSSLTHPASAPGSASGSRRASAQAGQSCHPRSRLGATEPVYGDFGVGPLDEPEQLAGGSLTERPMEDVTHSTDEGVATAGTSPEAQCPSEATTASDTTSDPETPSRQRPSQKQTEDICEVILRETFNVELQDLTFAPDALESVAHCLEELSHVVHNSTSLKLTGPFRVVPSGHHSSTPQVYPETNNPSNTRQTGRGKKRPSNGDRRADNDSGQGDGEDDNSGGEDNLHAKSKKIKVERPENRYPCPYRKRNPLKFNIRDYIGCATRCFSDLTDLKRHVKVYHRCQVKVSHVCPRCGVDQKTKEQLVSHLQLPAEDMCALQLPAEGMFAVRPAAHTYDPEEGITPEVEEKLNERKSTVKIDTWDNLWMTLFEYDDEVPHAIFYPPVELDEVQNQFAITMDDLRNRVQLESKTIGELSPEAQLYVASHMELACQDYISQVLSTSRLHVDYTPEKHHKRRKSQRSNPANKTPPRPGLLSPVMQRQILPKPLPITAEDERQIASKVDSVNSTGSSLSSSWETAISNRSSSKLQSTPSSTSLTTPGEPQAPMYMDQDGSFIHAPVSEVPPADSNCPAGIADEDAACAPDKGKAVCQDLDLDLIEDGLPTTGPVSSYSAVFDDGEAFEGFNRFFRFGEGYEMGDEGSNIFYPSDSAEFGLGQSSSGHMP